MHVERVTYDSALAVARNMREKDRDEIFATRWNDSAEDVALDCTVTPFAWTAFREGNPVAVVGAFPCHPGVWSVFMFATDEFDSVATSLTKFVKRVMIPALVESGAHRAECKSIEGHETAHRWLEFLGAHREAVLRDYGREGQDFYLFVWRR